MSRLPTYVGVLALLATPAIPLAQAPVQPQRVAARMPRVEPNDNRTPAGTVREGVTEIRLVAQLARWFPAGERDSSVVAPTLAEDDFSVCATRDTRSHATALRAAPISSMCRTRAPSYARSTRGTSPWLP